MKKLNYLFVLIVLSFISCEKELEKYNGKPTLYFEEAGRLPAFNSEVIKDSTVMSFSLTKSQDSIVNMVVSVIGEKVNMDRSYDLKINSASDAIEGVHYEFLEKTFVIKQNQLRDTVSIKFHRLTEMQTKTFLLSFDLVNNENFSVDMVDKLLNKTTGKRHSYINYRWFVNDIVKKPGRWLDGYFGTFSRKKLFLMVEVLGIEAAYLDANVSIAESVAYGKYMQRYLNEQRVAGNTIYEEDGTTVMVMGSGVQ